MIQYNHKIKINLPYGGPKMNVTFEQVDTILKTLPISYYATKKLDVELSKESTSTYIDILADKITISYSNICEVASKLLAKHPDKLEFIIRCLLYHEVSHAILTPSDLKNDDFVNLFEDNRIEVTLRDYYMGVDFLEFNKIWFDCYNKVPKTFEEFAVQVLFFRTGPKEFIDKVDKIIKDQNARQKSYAINPTYYSPTDDYVYDIKHFKNELLEYWNSNCDEYKEKLDKKIASNEKQTTNQSDSDKTPEAMLDDIKLNASPISTDVIAQKNLISTVLNIYDGSNIEPQVRQILCSIKSTIASSSAAINAYSGVFDPRSVVRDDYKYFVQQNRLGHKTAFAKLHLNLFIDTSGSFSDNDTTVNKILKTLTFIEKSNTNFSFDIVSMSIGEELLPKHHRTIKSDGGNDLDNEIFGLFKKLQLSQYINYNIVLFDGDAYTDTKWYSKIKPGTSMKAFDVRNCTVISNYDNQKYLDRYTSQCKKIFTANYTKELERHILTALNSFAQLF